MWILFIYLQSFNLDLGVKYLSYTFFAYFTALKPCNILISYKIFGNVNMYLK